MRAKFKEWICIHGKKKQIKLLNKIFYRKLVLLQRAKTTSKTIFMLYVLKLDRLDLTM